MKIKLVLPEDEPDYFRHARIETLKSIHEDFDPQLVNVPPIAFSFLAYDDHSDWPVGLAEITFHEQVYSSHEEGPYPRSCDLGRFCEFSQMAGIRTIFVEPEYRGKAASIYLQLVMAGAKVVSALGAKYGTATTHWNNRYLRGLYAKTGGTEMGPFRMDGVSSADLALFVFSIDGLLQHRLMKRATAQTVFDLDPAIARTIRSRSLVEREPLCA